jgi:hypothetical protein
MWLKLRVGVSDHCQRFGNCLGLPIPARRMDYCFARPLQYCARDIGLGIFVKTSTKSRPAYDEKLV